MIFFLLRKRLIDGDAIVAPIGANRKAFTATREFAGRAFEALSRPFLFAAFASKCAFVEVHAVGCQTLHPLEAKIDHFWHDQHAQVALRLEQREHSLDGIELSGVLFNC